MMEMMVNYLNECFDRDRYGEKWSYDGTHVAYMHKEFISCFLTIDEDLYMLSGRVSTVSRYTKNIYNIDELKNAIYKFFEDLKKLKVERRKKMIEEL